MTEQDVTFSDQEIKNVAEFVNFVYKRANWSISTPENQALSKHLGHMAAHIKKMEDHLFELKRVVPAKVDPKKKAKK